MMVACAYFEIVTPSKDGAQGGNRRPFVSLWVPSFDGMTKWGEVEFPSHFSAEATIAPTGRDL
jgi:hypothetical protein